MQRRQDLQAELAAEFATSSRAGAFLLPEAPEPEKITQSEEAAAPTWEQYSRYELWKLYEKANHIAIVRGAEIDRLNRAMAVQQEVSKANLQQCCDSFNDQVQEWEAKWQDKLAAQAEYFKKQLAVREVQLRNSCRQKIDEINRQASEELARKDCERRDAELDAELVRAKQHQNEKQWAWLSVVLVTFLLILAGFHYYQRRSYSADLDKAEEIEQQLQSEVAQLKRQLQANPPHRRLRPNKAPVKDSGQNEPEATN